MSRTISRRLLAQSPCALSTESTLNRQAPLRCLRSLSTTARRSADKDDDLASFLAARPAARTEQRRAPTPPSLSSHDSLSSFLDSPPSVAAERPSPASDAKGPMTSLFKSASSLSQSPRTRDRSSQTSLPTSKTLSNLSNMFMQNENQRNRGSRGPQFNMPNTTLEGTLIESMEEMNEDPHRFSIYATRHNTHINVGSPTGETLISLSCGNIGFKKSARKHYDSAFQLAGYVMTQMQMKGISANIRKMEVTLRGFGAGREAVTKALLGSEGRLLRGKIVKVADATRLKFGGTRSKKPRRLG